MWENLVMEAMGDFECSNPGVLELLQGITEETAWDTDGFSDAAKVIVEPEAYLCKYDVDIDSFHERCESEGMLFIKGIVQNEKWNHIIDIVNETGY